MPIRYDTRCYFNVRSKADISQLNLPHGYAEYTIITARCYASAVLAMGLCLCLSVSVSVTSRCSTKTAKRRITQTNTSRYPRESSFLVPKISAKFDRGHPLRGRQMQVGWVKICDFRQISGYISKIVKDRHIVSIKVE